MDDRDLEELTEKLKKEGDISLKEADRVFSLFSRKKPKHEAQSEIPRLRSASRSRRKRVV